MVKSSFLKFSFVAGLETDDSDEDDVIITSGPTQLRPKISPAKVCRRILVWHNQGWLGRGLNFWLEPYLAVFCAFHIWFSFPYKICSPLCERVHMPTSLVLFS